MDRTRRNINEAREKDGEVYHHHLSTPSGEPKSPMGVKMTVVNQCGYYVRENIPISFKLWKKFKNIDNDADIIPGTEKEMLWANVKWHFSFPKDKEEVFKDRVIKKMAISFRTFKKNLNKGYVQNDLTTNTKID